MRTARLKAAPDAPTAFYHCISRVVDRRFIFKDQERERFVQLMRMYEAFCGIHVLTYVVMSNHFHILVEVPKRPDVMPSTEAMLSRIEALYGELYAKNVRDLLATMTPEQANKHLLSYWSRTHDLSWFIRMIKQRFSQWYNLRNERRGTLWEERFKSVLVEGRGQVLAAMAAYIDLNPVRVGLVADPKDYRWCGYGEAVAGRPLARNGIRLIMSGLRNKKWDGVLEGYRVWMFGIADEMRGRGGVPPERVDEVIRAKGKLPLTEYLRCRVRYFVDGVAIGSKAFVEGVQRARAVRQQGEGAGTTPETDAGAKLGDRGWGMRRRRRRLSARLFQGLDFTHLELFSLRGLRKQPILGVRGSDCG